MKCIAHDREYCPTCNTYQPPKPFRASFEGYAATDEAWSNTVRVEAVEDWSTPSDGEPTEPIEKYADYGDLRQLVEIDTNYKDTRPGQHPVRLTRPDAVKLAAAVLAATEDTFHYGRCGQLRPAEAAELLRELADVEFHLQSLREHALGDLLAGAGLDPDHTDDTEPAAEVIATIPVAEESFAGVILALFPDSAEAITNSDAFGALSYKVSRRCRETGHTARQVLESLDADTRAFAPHADDPAAFLASRIDS